MKIKVIDSFVKTHGFRSKSEIVILNEKGQFAYTSDYWGMNRQNQYIYDVDIQDYSGINQEIFENLTANQVSVTVSKLNREGQKKKYEITSLLVQDQFDPNDPRDYIKIGVETTESFFIVLLYSEQDQMLQVKDRIENQSLNLESLNVKICISTSIITIILVCAASYSVSNQVDGPLRLLILVLQSLNISKTIKESKLQKIYNKINFQVSISQYQVKELLISFNTLIETLIERNFNNQNITIKSEIVYPLNELEKQFVKQTQNNQSIFDWEYLMDKVVDSDYFLTGNNQS